MEEQIEKIARDLIGSYGWMLVAAIMLLTFKNVVQRLVEGFMFFVGNDY